MNQPSKNNLVDRYMFLSTGNLSFLDEYIASHVTVNNYSEAMREILYAADINDKQEKAKLNAMGKDISIILEMLKNNDEAKYLEAKKQVETEIQRQVTRESNSTNSKSDKKSSTSTSSSTSKLDLSFLGLYNNL